MEKHAKPLTNENVDLHFLGIVAAVVAVIITLVIFAIWRRKKSIGNSVLLTGLSDAGKTLIFARLSYSMFVKTHTSAKENMGDITVNNCNLKVIDIPGHERLRYKYFDRFKSSAKGLIYVIDSVTFQKDIRDVAEYLYNILSDSVMQKSIPVLILCNKQDQTMAKGSTVVKALLEKEMNLLRMTKTSQVEAIDASNTNFYLGKQGKDFEFAHLVQKIEFAESTAFDKDSETGEDLDQVANWLKKIT